MRLSEGRSIAAGIPGWGGANRPESPGHEAFTPAAPVEPRAAREGYDVTAPTANQRAGRAGQQCAEWARGPELARGV